MNTNSEQNRRGFAMKLLLVLAALLAAAPLAAFAETPQVHFIRSTSHWTTIQTGAALPVILMTMPPIYSAHSSGALPVLLQAMKPLPDCRILGTARWVKHGERLIFSANSISCGQGKAVKMRGYAIGDRIMGLTPQTGSRVAVVFTQTVKIPR